MTCAEQQTPDRLLTPQEVAARLGVTDRWIRRALAEGRLEVVKLGRLNRFRESYVEAFIQANTHAPEGD